MTRIRDQFLVRRDATRIAALRDRAAEGPTPFVSIVIVSRDGAEHLRVLLPTLGRAAYPRFEVIVVDNGSTDATEELLAARWPFDLRAVRNEENRSFSEANNQALAIAGGQFVLFLNNDVLPVGEHWLGWMVAAATSNSRPSAVGALLLHPPAPGEGRTIRVQHAGIRFGFRDGHPHPRNQRGDDGTARKLATRFEVPAVTAAALLAAREDLEEVGGFPDGYWYGA